MQEREGVAGERWPLRIAMKAVADQSSPSRPDKVTGRILFLANMIALDNWEYFTVVTHFFVLCGGWYMIG